MSMVFSLWLSVNEFFLNVVSHDRSQNAFVHALVTQGRGYVSFSGFFNTGAYELNNVGNDDGILMNARNFARCSDVDVHLELLVLDNRSHYFLA